MSASKSLVTAPRITATGTRYARVHYLTENELNRLLKPSPWRLLLIVLAFPLGLAAAQLLMWMIQ